jgi:hypothetical protein
MAADEKENEQVNELDEEMDESVHQLGDSNRVEVKEVRRGRPPVSEEEREAEKEMKLHHHVITGPLSFANHGCALCTNILQSQFNSRASTVEQQSQFQWQVVTFHTDPNDKTKTKKIPIAAGAELLPNYYSQNSNVKGQIPCGNPKCPSKKSSSSSGNQ